MKTTTQIYYNLITKYGIMTVLMLNKRFENEERYLECQKIVDAIGAFNVANKCELPLAVDKDTTLSIINAWTQRGWDTNNITKTYCYYFDIVLAELKSNFEL